MYGELIRQKIDDSGLSIRNIAKNIGVSAPTVYNWCETGVLSSEMIFQLSKVLNCDLFTEASKIFNTSVNKTDTIEDNEIQKPSFMREKLELQQKIIDTLEKRQADLEERIGELKKRLGD